MIRKQKFITLDIQVGFFIACALLCICTLYIQGSRITGLEQQISDLQMGHRMSTFANPVEWQSFSSKSVPVELPQESIQEISYSSEIGPVAESNVVEELSVAETPVIVNLGTSEETEVTAIEAIEEVTPNVSMEMFEPSGLTAEQIDSVIAETLAYYGIDPDTSLLTGMGNSLLEQEQTYGVNALYICAIAQRESGLNSSNYSIRTNNITSITLSSGDLKQYSSVSECIMDTGRLLSSLYYDTLGYRTIQGVGNTYCPLNPNWGDEVFGFFCIMHDLAIDA